jgi:hypothetical protein
LQRGAAEQGDAERAAGLARGVEGSGAEAGNVNDNGGPPPEGEPVDARSLSGL